MLNRFTLNGRTQFPKKTLVYIHDGSSFYKCLTVLVLVQEFSWSRCNSSNERNNSENCIEYTVSSPTVLPKLYWLLAIGSWVKRKWVSWDCPIFLWSHYLYLNIFYFKKKKNLKFDESISVPSFDTMWENPYSVYTCELWNLPICFGRPQRKYEIMKSVKSLTMYIFLEP